MTLSDGLAGALAPPSASLAARRSADASQWLLFRGNAARNASTRSTGPLLSTVWRGPHDRPAPGRSDHGRHPADVSRSRSMGRFPTCHPLVAGGLVLMRTATNLVAVDLATGKRRWETPVDDPFESRAFAGGGRGQHGAWRRRWASSRT